MDRRALTKTLIASAAAGIATPRLLTAQTPSASPAATAATAAGDTIRKVNIDGSALALSPDGTLLAGIIDRERLAAWDTATLELVARSEPIPELLLLDDPSVTWSPTSDAVAFSLLAALHLRDSDIYVFDINTGAITNLTDDEPVDDDAPTLLPAGNGADVPPLDVDLYPSWSADGTDIVFSRTIWDGADELTTGLWSIPREGGEATQIASVAPYPMHVSSVWAGLEDGRVLCSAWPPTGGDPADPHHGVFLVTPDGEVEGISTGMLASKTPGMVLIDVLPADRKASLVSLANLATLDNPGGPIWIEMDLDTGIPTAFEEVLSLPTETGEGTSQNPTLLGSPAFLTDTDGALTGYLYATMSAEVDTFTLWRHNAATGQADTIGILERGGPKPGSMRQISRIEIGANGTAAILHFGDAWLTSIEGA